MSVKHEKNNQLDSNSSTPYEESQFGSPQFDPTPVTGKLFSEDISKASQQKLIHPRLKVLFVCEIKPVWVSLALRLDASGCTEPRFSWASTSEEALKLLRNDSYDCLLFGIDYKSKAKQLVLLEAIRSSGCHDPIVLVLSASDDQVAIAGCEFQADILVSAAMWESPALLSIMKRAMKVYQLNEENHRLLVENHRRLIRERDESERLLNQQRSMVSELQSLTYPDENETPEKDGSSTQNQNGSKLDTTSNEFQIPIEVQDYYHELLRTYVIMGSGSLKDEILQIAELLSKDNLAPSQVLEFHLECVEAIVKGLGNRSSRHVMARADLLALEIMVHLGECYQKKNTL